MFKMNVGFLNRSELNEVVQRTILRQSVDVSKIMDGPRVLELRKALDNVVVADPIRDFACRLTLATHPDSEFATDSVKRFIKWGASPRAAQALIRAGRVRALSQGRAHVATEDIRYFADEVLRHRMLLNYDGQAENIAPEQLIEDVLEHTSEQAVMA